MPNAGNEDKASPHRRERIAGSFDRTITLPIRIDPDRIKAEYRDGILALLIPRAESDKPRSIKIGASQERMRGKARFAT